MTVPATAEPAASGLRRLVKALQISAVQKIATSDNWQLGQDVIVSPPQTAEGTGTEFPRALIPKTGNLRCAL